MSKWGLSNGGLRPLSAISAQSSTIVSFWATNVKGIVVEKGENDGNCKQLLTIMDKHGTVP